MNFLTKNISIALVFAIAVITSWSFIEKDDEAMTTVNLSQPNIIFLLSDDQSTYSVGAYGNKDVNTPQMLIL